MLLALSFAAAYSGWLCVALAMRADRRRLEDGPSTQAAPVACLRILAVVLAAVSFALCVLRDGAAFGSLLWLCLLCVGAWLTVLTRTVLGDGSRSAIDPVDL